MQQKMNLRIPDDVIFRVLGDEAMILNLVTRTYFSLDSVGTRIWQIIAEHGSAERVIETFLAEYEVQEGQLRQDLIDLIRQLKDKGLLLSNVDETA